jgi:uncharacterized protein YaeQ
MALTATMYHLRITLSDVDRAVYESLDLRVARHPSESGRYLVTRILAYCLSYEDGICFSKGGLSDADEPPVAVRDRTGVLVTWIDVGAPSAERLHKASKAARRVAVYTHVDPLLLRREASSRVVYKLEDIDVIRFEPSFVDAVDAKIGRSTDLEIVRNDGQVYVTVDGTVIEVNLERVNLADAGPAT